MSFSLVIITLVVFGARAEVPIEWGYQECTEREPVRCPENILIFNAAVYKNSDFLALDLIKNILGQRRGFPSASTCYGHQNNRVFSVWREETRAKSYITIIRKIWFLSDRSRIYYPFPLYFSGRSSAGIFDSNSDLKIFPNFWDQREWFDAINSKPCTMIKHQRVTCRRGLLANRLVNIPHLIQLAIENYRLNNGCSKRKKEQNNCGPFPKGTCAILAAAFFAIGAGFAGLGVYKSHDIGGGMGMLIASIELPFIASAEICFFFGVLRW